MQERSLEHARTVVRLVVNDEAINSGDTTEEMAQQLSSLRIDRPLRILPACSLQMLLYTACVILVGLGLGFWLVRTIHRHVPARVSSTSTLIFIFLLKKNKESDFKVSATLMMMTVVPAIVIS